MRKELLVFIFTLCSVLASAQQKVPNRFRSNIPLDSIHLSDPCILADKKTSTYYMTGTGGLLWKSKDLARWEGPYRVAETDPDSWMGSKPEIWAAELHEYNGKYYYFATFTNNAIKIDTVKGNVIPRRASHILVSDKPDGPYKPMKDPTYLPENMPTLDGTFWVDSDGKPYMIYCHEWLQNWNGTMEKIELKPDLSGSIGKGKILFRASDSLEPRKDGGQSIAQPCNRRTMAFPHRYGPVRHDMDKLGIPGLYTGRCLFRKRNSGWTLDTRERTDHSA